MLRPACVASPWETLSGNRRAGVSHCVSLPVPVPFPYSGNLRSGREGLADTTQQPASGRGDETERMTGRERERETCRVRQKRRRGCREAETERDETVAAVTPNEEPEKRGGRGDFIVDRTRARKLRGPEMKKKGRAENVDERGEGNRERRGGGRRQGGRFRRGGWG